MITRLLNSFIPSSYKLKLDIDEKELLFKGTVEISGKKVDDSLFINLHSKELEILHVFVDGIESEFTIEKSDILKISTGSKKAKISNVKINIDFSGKITDSMNGMYPCYFNHEGKKKWLIATQFESHHAREVFPCIDEPAAKAIFNLELTTDSKNQVISNMPVLSKLKNGKRTKTIFETTPKMSTYLLAFVTGEMNFLQASTKDGVIVRSWASVTQPVDHLQYSVDEAVKTIEFYNQYFGVPYPLKKCDQVALPDFDAGAMENWGLITYRESALLADPTNRSISSEQYISLVIAHEVSHQWFGNLVTMTWWDDLWLNESFASVMEYVALDALHPDWQIWESYAASDAISASNRDVYEDVQPVRVEVNDPAEITALFDGAIVYAKGGRLLKMLMEYVGEVSFKKALTNYFTKHAYKNTSRDDLWDAIEEVTKMPIGEIMNSWLEQSGAPVLEVNQSEDKLEIKQSRFLLNGSSSDQIWQVPLLSKEPIEPNLLKTRSGKFKVDSKEPLLLNLSGSGHYVTSYQQDFQKQALASAVESQSIPASGRIIAMNDSILLSKSGKQSLTGSLDLISKCKGEPRNNVWGLIAGIIGQSRVLTEGNNKTESEINNFCFNLVEQQYNQLGWDAVEAEDPNTTQLRVLIAALALASENREVIETAIAKYNHDKPQELNSEIRSLLMSAVVRFGDIKEVDVLLNIYKNTSSPDLRDDINGALTSTKDPETIEKLLQMLKDKDQVRPQDIVRWYAQLIRNKYSREQAWSWLKENWSWIMDTFGSSKSYDYFPRYAATFFNTKELLEEYEKFFKPMLSDPALKRTIEIGISELRARVNWRNRDEPKIVEWFANLSD